MRSLAKCGVLGVSLNVAGQGQRHAKMNPHAELLHIEGHLWARPCDGRQQVDIRAVQGRRSTACSWQPAAALREAHTHHVGLRGATRLEEAAEVAAVGVLLAATRRDGALRLCACHSVNPNQ